MAKYIPKRLDVNRISKQVICDAIIRCDTVCNPAVIEKDYYSIHVRKLSASEGKGWIVRVILKDLVNKI